MPDWDGQLWGRFSEVKEPSGFTVDQQRVATAGPSVYDLLAKPKPKKATKATN